MSPRGGEARFGVRYTQEGMEALLGGLDKFIARVRGADQSVRRTTRSTHELGRSFRNIALRTIAYLGIVRGFSAITNAFRSATATGLEYNETIEQSRLAIASLITAQADLFDATGKQIHGVEALDAAYTAATDQVRKLRIAGIQTAATTKELVDAFQQAVGAGLASGLTLDEVRMVTIRIAQAAGALGVPYRQLNEEIRSILGGIIDQNTRIAKALQMRNEEIQLAKEQGRLAEFLLEKFDAFGVAGERIVETWAALKSNVQETFELFAGEVTFPMFEAVRLRGLSAVQRIFDFDTAEISREFASLVRNLQKVFAGIGDQIAGTFERALDTAVNLNTWLTINEETVNEIIFSVGELVRGLGEMVGGVTRIAGGIAKWSVELGLVEQAIQTIADTFKTIGRQPTLSALTLGGVTLGVFATINAVLGSTAVIVTGVVAAFGALVATLDHFTDSAAEAVTEMTRIGEEQTNLEMGISEAAYRAQNLAREYYELKNALRENRVEAEKVEDVQNRLADILDELNDLNPAYAQAVRETTGAEKEYIKAVNEIIKLELERVEGKIRWNEILREQAQRELERLEAEGAEFGQQSIWRRLTHLLPWVGLPEAFEDISRDNVIAELAQQILEAGENAERLKREALELQKILLGKEFEIKGPERDDAEERLKARRAAIELEIARMQNALKVTEAELRQQWETDIINYSRYFDRLNEEQQRTYTRMIELREELAELEGTDDPQRRARALIQVEQLKAQAQVALIENELARRREGLKFAEAAAKVEAGILKTIGDEVGALRIRLEQEWEEIIADLSRQGRKGMQEIAEIRRWIDLQIARAAFTLYEDELARVQTATQNAIAEIEQLQSVGAIQRPVAQQRIADEYERLLETIQRLLPHLREQADILKDPESAARIAELESQMRQLGITIENLRDVWKEFREDVFRAVQTELSRYLTDAVVKAESLGDAFKNLVGSLEAVRNLLGQIAAQIVEIAAREIAFKIAAAAFTAAKLPPPAAARGGYVAPKAWGGPILAYPTGGQIRGPGTGTSDSILARVSAGEFIVRAASVKKYGIDFLHALNRGAMPRQVIDLKGYATGGVVGADRPPQTTKDFRGELTIGLSEGLILDELDTPDGERLILKVINKNRRGILSGLGI